MENIREIIQNLKDKTTAAENKIQKFEQEIEIKTQEKYELMRNSNLNKEKRDVELLILEDVIKRCEKSKEALEIEIKGNNDSIIKYSMNLATLSKQQDGESSLTNYPIDQSQSSSKSSESDNPHSIPTSLWAFIDPKRNRFFDVVNFYCIRIKSISFEEFIGYFNRGVSNTNIVIPKYEWGRFDHVNSGKSYEVSKHPEIFSHIEKHLLPNGYSCQMGCEQFLKIKVPCFPNYMFVGRLDGIICQQQLNDDDSKLTSTFIAFEIEQNLEQDTQSSSLLELIGALIKSQFPVLHIQTDMNTFNFMIHRENYSQNILFNYTTESYCECKTIIENWIKYSQDNRGQSNHIKKRSCDIEKELENPQYVLISSLEKAKTMVDNDLSDDELNRLNRLEESFLSQDTREKLNLISGRNRSGPVYKVEHENKLLAMKICHVDARDHYGKMILYDLINEADIYKRLQGVDGPWPKLFFSGYIFNYNYYTIVTEFIEGRHPESEDKADFKICYESLKKLHELDIIHSDPRPPNFIIETNSQKAFVLDFGFSFVVEDWEKRRKIKKDFKKMKSSDGFNIKD